MSEPTPSAVPASAAGPTPANAAFDRAAATILGSMVTLIAALSFLLVEVSVGNDPGQVPVAAAQAESRDTP
ncbi:MAG TPA: hypothetical protein VFM14_16490 [Gemmatimonadales bacterium]|nr:hypothetical protein [Gemmatimonadales bacterium]